ncbi:MAG TPA: ribbon-helix-helix protein, CopG family [Jatrophihabitans sp.]
MAMTLRLTEDETDALREFAEASGRSMQDVARQAIHDFVTDRKKMRDDILHRIVTEDAEALDLLSK